MKAYVSADINESLEVRGFSKKINQDLLEWHRDAENRNIFVESGAGWLLQIDNQLPIKLEEGKSYKIEREVFHRLIKENTCTDLLIVIRKS